MKKDEKVYGGVAEIFEWIADRVPGYRAYRAREKLRDADKKVREFLAEKLTGIKEKLTDVKRKLTDAGILKGQDKIDFVIRKLERIRDSALFAERGFSGIFDPQKVREDKLKELYQYDRMLIEQVELIITTVEDFAASPAPSADVASLTNKLDEFLNQFDKEFSQRSEIIEKIDKE